MTATRGQRDLTCGRQVVMLSSGCHSCLEGCGLSRETSDVDRWRSLILQHRGGRLQRTAPLGAPAGALALHWCRMHHVVSELSAVLDSMLAVFAPYQAHQQHVTEPPGQPRATPLS